MSSLCVSAKTGWTAHDEVVQQMQDLQLLHTTTLRSKEATFASILKARDNVIISLKNDCNLGIEDVLVSDKCNHLFNLVCFLTDLYAMQL